MKRTSFKFRNRRSTSPIVSIYEYLRETYPYTLALLARSGLFDERLFLSAQKARYVPLSEELSVSELRQLMAAPRGRHER